MKRSEVVNIIKDAFCEVNPEQNGANYKRADILLSKLENIGILLPKNKQFCECGCGLSKNSNEWEKE